MDLILKSIYMDSKKSSLLVIKNTGQKFATINKTSRHCGICGQCGHNSRTCKNKVSAGVAIIEKRPLVNICKNLKKFKKPKCNGRQNCKWVNKTGCIFSKKTPIRQANRKRKSHGTRKKS